MYGIDDWLEEAFEDRVSMSEQLDRDVEFLEHYEEESED